jgi:hypothetical protein
VVTRAPVAVVFALVALLGATGAAHAAGPGVRCEAEQIGRRTLAHVDLIRFFDRELLRLIRLGLEGRGHVTFTLVKRRWAWFDDVVLRLEQDFKLTWDAKRRVFLLDGYPLDAVELNPLHLGRLTLGRREEDTVGTHYVEVSVRFQVVTVGSLMTAATWLTGTKGEDVVSTRVAKVVAEDLVRTARTSCDVEKAP